MIFLKNQGLLMNLSYDVFKTPTLYILEFVLHI